jgi:hypothetical protein
MSNEDPAAVPVAKFNRRYDSVEVNHIFQAHNGGLHLFHPVAPPWEIREGSTSAETLNLNKKQARSLRDQLIAMNLGDNDEKEN